MNTSTTSRIEKVLATNNNKIIRDFLLDSALAQLVACTGQFMTCIAGLSARILSRSQGSGFEANDETLESNSVE